MWQVKHSSSLYEDQDKKRKCSQSLQPYNYYELQKGYKNGISIPTNKCLVKKYGQKTFQEMIIRNQPTMRKKGAIPSLTHHLIHLGFQSHFRQRSSQTKDYSRDDYCSH